MLTITEIYHFLSVYEILKLNLFPLYYFLNIKNLIENFIATVIKTVWFLLNDKQQSMKLNAESRNRSTHMWSIDFQQFNREKLIFSTTNGAGKRAINVQINEP